MPARTPLIAGAVALTLTLPLTAVAPAWAAVPEAPYRFDFQPAGAPLGAGFVEVTRATAYTPERGYGIVVDPTNSMLDRNRGGSDPVGGDFVAYFGGTYEFRADIPDGEYDVRLVVGELGGSATTEVAIEGAALGSISANKSIATRDYPGIQVRDGQFNLTISGRTGHLSGVIITPVIPGPATLDLAGLSVSGDLGTVTLAWPAVDSATGYRIFRDAGDGPVLLGESATTTFVDETAAFGQTYAYTVVGVTANGIESKPSPELTVPVFDPTVTPPAAPAAPRITDIGEREIVLSWDPVASADTYRVERATRADGPFDVVAERRSSSFTDADVYTTRSYHYRVVAMNRGGLSEASPVVSTEPTVHLKRQAEYLDRAPMAVPSASGVFVGWRMAGGDPDDIAFTVYRDGSLITPTPVTGSTSLRDADGTAASVYRIAQVVDGVETWATGEFRVWSSNHLDIPLDKPADGQDPNGDTYTYRANDVSVADLDGDGRLDYVVKWDPSNSRDNSQAGHTGNVLLDAYTVDGERLWRVDLGRNVRAGAHYSPMVVYDLDGSGAAEVVVRTADATVDGQGQVIGDADADWRNASGYVLNGPEFLTVFDGRTGAAIDTIDYVPARGSVASWGDTYGNRVDRFLSAVAYLDGQKPSAVFARGYYTRAVLAAFDFDGQKLTQRWVFDSTDEGNGGYAGQGNHNLAVADVDDDQLDEIVYGSATIDDDGSGLYSTGLGHGDALHVSDLVPQREGLEVFAAHEVMSASGGRGATMRDGATGEVLWGIPAVKDTGRAASADIDPTHDGAEGWAVGGDAAWNSPVGSLRTALGEEISTSIPAANFVTWWDGDLLREIADHQYDAASEAGEPVVYQWNWQSERQEEIFRPEGVLTNNGTKGNPALQADLFGDWREELVYRTKDSSALRIFTTTDETDHRLRTLLSDPVYRLGVAWQNVGYNQPPHTSYFLGEGMRTPAQPAMVYTGHGIAIPVGAVRAGEQAAVRFVGYRPGEEVKLTADGQVVARATADATGSGHLMWGVPVNTAAGTIPVQVRGAASGSADEASIDVRKEARSTPGKPALPTPGR